MPTVQVSPSNSTILTTSTTALVLTATVSPGTAANGTWSWFNGGVVIGPTSATFSVTPAQFGPGQWLFTYTYPGPCGPVTASAYVTVIQTACPISTEPKIVVLKDTVYTGLTAGQLGLFNDPDKVYQLKHNVRLIDGNFQLHTRCKIYFDKDVKLTLGPGAALSGVSATLTAACGDMWDGILLADGCGGLDLKKTTISHSQRGIVLQYPDLPLSLRLCEFENNLENITIVPAAETHPRRQTVDPTWQNDIAGCSFTAHDFLSPWAGHTRRSRTHLNIGNWDVRAWTIAGNTFDKALISVYGGERVGEPASSYAVGATLQGNFFTNTGIAGVMAPKHAWVGTATGNRFVLDASTTVGNPFGQAVMSAYQLPADAGQRPTGMYLSKALADCHVRDDNQFTYAQAPPSYQGFGSLASPTFPAPRGIYVRYGRPRIEGNTFRNLDAGVTLGAMGGTQLIDNLFDNCRLNVRLLPVDAVYTHAIRLTCNTFRRTTALGQSVGILIDPGAWVEFARRNNAGAIITPVFPPNSTPGTPGDVMKNLFTGSGQSGSGNEFWHIRNDAAQTVTYKTFALDPITGAPQTNITNLVTFGPLMVPTVNAADFRNGAAACSVEDTLSNGIQTRSARSAPRSTIGLLGVPVPNPADASVAFTYALPGGAASGELVLRESFGGRVVLRRAVVTGESAVVLSVASLPPGLYLGMLVVGGRPLASVRLQINR